MGCGHYVMDYLPDLYRLSRISSVCWYQLLKRPRWCNNSSISHQTMVKRNPVTMRSPKLKTNRTQMSWWNENILPNRSVYASTNALSSDDEAHKGRIGLFSKPRWWSSSQPNTENSAALISKSGRLPITRDEKYCVQLEILLLADELLHNTSEVSWTSALTTMKT